MATTAPSIEELNSGLLRMAKTTETARESSEGIADSFSKLLRTLVPIEASVKVVSALMGDFGGSASHALTVMGKTTAEIILQRNAAKDSLETARLHVIAGDLSRRTYIEMILAYKRGDDLHRKELEMQTEINKAGRYKLVIGAAVLEQMAATLYNNRKINEALHEADSSYSNRLSLAKSIADVQLKTGTQFETAIEASKSLVKYALDTKSTYQLNLKTVVQLHDALGLSTDEAAHLAAVTENYVLGSFQSVADVLATIVDKTSLAASEVKTLGIELSNALGIMNPGEFTGFPQVLKVLSSYEDSLKQVGGHVGTFQKLVSQLSTPEGLQTAGVLGVTPEMIQTKEGLDQIMSSLQNVIKVQVGESQGRERMLRLSALGTQLNMTANEISQMSKALAQHSKVTQTDITLQQRFNNEMFNLDQGVRQLMASLSSLVQQGLTPIAFIVNKIVQAAAAALRTFSEIPGIGYAAMAVTTVAVGALAVSLRGVVRGFVSVASAAHLAAKKLQEQAALQLLKDRNPLLDSDYLARVNKKRAAHGLPHMPMPAPTGPATVTSTVLGYLKNSVTSPIATAIRGMTIASTAGFAAVVIPAAATAYWAHRVWSETKEIKQQSDALNARYIQKSINEEQRLRSRMYLSERYGNSEDAAKAQSKLLTEVRNRLTDTKGLSQADVASQLGTEAEVTLAERKRAMYTRAATSYGAISGTMSSDTKVYDAKIAAETAETAKILKELLQTATRQFIINKEVREEHKVKEEWGLMKEMRAALKDSIGINPYR